MKESRKGMLHSLWNVVGAADEGKKIFFNETLLGMPAARLT